MIFNMQWIKSVFYSGIAGNTRKSTAVRIRVVNASSLILGCVNLFYSIIYFLVGVYWLSLAALLQGALFICVLGLNYKRHYKYATLLLFTMYSSIILLYSCLYPPEIYVRFLFLTNAPLAFFLIPRSEPGSRGFFILIPIVLFLLLEQGFQFGIPRIDFTPRVLTLVKYTVFILLFALLILLQAIPVATAEKFESHILGKNRELGEMIIRLTHTESQLMDSQKVARLGYYTLDLDNHIMEISPPLLEILGLSYKNQLLPLRDFFGMLQGDKEETHRMLLEDAITSKTGFNLDARLKRPDGREIWIFNKCYMDPWDLHVGDGDTTIRKMTGIIQDITQRKETEVSLRAAREEALKAKLAKDEFLSVMSHEIRTPLNVLLGMAHILSQENPREDQARYLAGIKSSGANLLALLNDILDFNKIEVGKVDLELVETDLRDFLAGVYRTFSPHAEEKGLELTLNLRDNLPRRVSLDQIRLGQILNNLIANAIKFTTRGYVRISVESRGERAGDAILEFIVEDTGIGIDEGQLENIFKRFTQARSDITRRFGGTGLGLAISKRLLELMGGELFVKSKPGKGARFFFSIRTPIVNVSSPAFQAQARARTQEKGPGKIRAASKAGDLLKGMKVLLVEDNEDNRLVADLILRKWGVLLAVAENGKEATERVVEQKFDLILMDLQMPVMDGFTATLLIRDLDDPFYKRLPIVALTADAFTDIKERCKKVGMNDYLSKPLNPDRLYATLEKYYRGESPAGDWSGGSGPEKLSQVSGERSP